MDAGIESMILFMGKVYEVVGTGPSKKVREAGGGDGGDGVLKKTKFNPAASWKAMQEH